MKRKKEYVQFKEKRRDFFLFKGRVEETLSILKLPICGCL
jgi:hypothetical protein